MKIVVIAMQCNAMQCNFNEGDKLDAHRPLPITVKRYLKNQLISEKWVEGIIIKQSKLLIS